MSSTDFPDPTYAGPMWSGRRLVWGPAHVPGPVTVLKSYGELSAEATAFELAALAKLLPSRMGGTADVAGRRVA